jgi:hypothetical protein
MIKANELRIGNYVQDEHFRVGIVKSVSDRSVRVKMEHSTLKRDSNVDFDGLDIEPITLTPEILEKCGFEKINKGLFKPVFGNYSHIFKTDFYPLSLEIEGNRIPLKNIKYLHQLQNLYYTLTGEELNIEPTVQVSDTTQAS